MISLKWWGHSSMSILSPKKKRSTIVAKVHLPKVMKNENDLRSNQIKIKCEWWTIWCLLFCSILTIAVYVLTNFVAHLPHPDILSSGTMCSCGILDFSSFIQCDTVQSIKCTQLEYFYHQLFCWFVCT